MTARFPIDPVKKRVHGTSVSEVKGIGVGLRMELARELLERQPEEIGWLEIHPENYVSRGGRYATALREARDQWPIVTHGLTMGFGSIEPFDSNYLGLLRDFLQEVSAPWHSDHLCFPGIDGQFVHDLLPLPLNEQSIQTAVQRVREMRDALGIPVAVENVSYYAPSDGDEMSEAEFVCEVIGRADAALLLDVNNVYVNSRNHGFDAKKWIRAIPGDRVVQIHVAGHLVRNDGFRIDTHSEPICQDVFELLEFTLEHLGDRPVLLERDGSFPPLDTLLAEARALSAISERARSKRFAATRRNQAEAPR